MRERGLTSLNPFFHAGGLTGVISRRLNYLYVFYVLQFTNDQRLWDLQVFSAQITVRLRPFNTAG